MSTHCIPSTELGQPHSRGLSTRSGLKPCTSNVGSRVPRSSDAISRVDHVACIDERIVTVESDGVRGQRAPRRASGWGAVDQAETAAVTRASDSGRVLVQRHGFRTPALAGIRRYGRAGGSHAERDEATRMRADRRERVKPATVTCDDHRGVVVDVGEHRLSDAQGSRIRYAHDAWFDEAVRARAAIVGGCAARRAARRIAAGSRAAPGADRRQRRGNGEQESSPSDRPRLGTAHGVHLPVAVSHLRGLVHPWSSLQGKPHAVALGPKPAGSVAVG